MPRPRADAHELEARVKKAAASDLLWEMSVGSVMRHFRINHDSVRRAKLLAQETRPKAVFAAQRRADAQRRFDRCVRIERLHAHIHGRLADESAGSAARVAEAYGLSRVRAGQVKHELVSLAALRRLTAVAMAEEIEAAARAASPVEA